MRRHGAPIIFTGYGYTFKLLKISRNIALYEQSKNGRVFAYEVHILKRQGTLSSPRSKSDGGYYLWSYEHRENAEKKFEELTR